VKYHRLYADADGESHIEEVAVEMESVEFAPPSPAMHVAAFQPATQYSFVTLPPGWGGGPHNPPSRIVTVVLSGAIEYTASDGSVQEIRSGSVISVEDTAGAVAS
jgi:quercetin dioxygenase-like cupin family protein